MTELQWNIGKGGAAPLDKPPFRAYFWWVRDGQIVQAADFSRDELEAEVRRRATDGEDTHPFYEALVRLRSSENKD